MATYNYYTLSFVYCVNRKDINDSWDEFFKADPQNESGALWSPAEGDAASYVETFVEAFLAGAGIEFRHEYSWPDGSCYKLIRIDADQDIDELVKLLNSRSESKTAYKLRIGGWTLEDPVSTRCNDKTAEQQFAEQPSP